MEFLTSIISLLKYLMRMLHNEELRNAPAKQSTVSNELAESLLALKQGQL